MGFPLIPRVIAVALVALPLFCQAQNPKPADQSDQDDQAQRKVYVKRISFGASITANLPGPIKEENLSQTFTGATPLAITTTNANKSSLPGFGAVVQLALTSHFALAITPVMRTGIKYESQVQRAVGNDNPNTIQDDRAITNLTVQNTARFLDVPVLVRWYTKSRYDRGPRVFFEVGPRMRRAYAVRNTTHVQPPPNKGDAYDFNDNVSFKKISAGATAGFGLQFIDDFGIRFIPEVRYTRFFNRNFGDITGRSRQHQIEIVFSLTF